MTFPVSRPFLGAILLLTAVLTGCGHKDNAAFQQRHPIDPNQPPVQGDWVVQRINADVDTLNPITGEDTNGAVIRSQLVNESLLQMNNFTLKLEPCLAESWEVSPDQLTYIFHLRHGVKWHDGQPFTVDDVKYTFDKLMDPKVDSAPIRVYFSNIKSCDIVDPFTVRFTATERYFKTLEVLGTFMAIVPKHVLEKGEPDFNKHPFGRAPIGTGPYKFVRWDTGAQIVFERNDDYWGGPIHYPRRIVYRVIEEPYIATQLFKKGEIDVLDGVSPVLWKWSLEHSPSMERGREIVYPFPNYNYLGFNLRLPIFSDVRVRHAIDLLLPRDKILSQIYLDQYADKTAGYDPPSSPSYNHDIAPTPFDPAQAAQLLQQAGWRNDHGDGLLYKDGQPLSFTLLYGAGNTNAQKMAELMQETLRQAGIDLKLQSLEFAQMIARMDDWKFDAVLSGWSTDFNGDPSQLWDGSQAKLKKSSNFIGYDNPLANQLIAQGKLEYDDNKRNAIYRHLQQVIHDDYPVCFLFNARIILVISDRFQNVKIFAPRPCFDISTWWVPQPWQKYTD
ncbi:MAG: ABC transporter substrate-binding protein [Methylacidiphilales bacterium]|nr:ABC transporter substrate-binding protein [Candidatus Methylacidiphilales bacterium]